MTKKKNSSSKTRPPNTKKKSAPKAKGSQKKKSNLQQNINENTSISLISDDYANFANGLSVLLEESRHLAARSVNALLTATYWEMGRRIVEIEQNGKIRAEYGTQLLLQLSRDLTAKFGRGFSVDNLERMRMFYNAYPQISDSTPESDDSQAAASLEQKSASVMRKSSPESLGEYLTSLQCVRSENSKTNN